MAMALLRGVEAWLVAYCLLLVGGGSMCATIGGGEEVGEEVEEGNMARALRGCGRIGH